MAYSILSTCTKCGACLPECPTNSITEGPKQFYIDTDTCMDHASCVNVCPVEGAIVALASTPLTGQARREEEEE